VKGWRKVAVVLRKARKGSASVLPFPRPTGAAVLPGKGDTRFFSLRKSVVLWMPNPNGIEGILTWTVDGTPIEIGPG
jgi:hypothetical protein